LAIFIAFDDERIELIRSTVLGYVNGTVEEKMKTWLKCAKAMSKKMLEMKKVKRLASIRI